MQSGFTEFNAGDLCRASCPSALQQGLQEFFGVPVGQGFDEIAVEAMRVIRPGIPALRPSYASSHFNLILKEKSLRHIRLPDLRHNCASMLAAAGVPMKQIQLWLRHSNYSTHGLDSISPEKPLVSQPQPNRNRASGLVCFDTKLFACFQAGDKVHDFAEIRIAAFA